MTAARTKYPSVAIAMLFGFLLASTAIAEDTPTFSFAPPLVDLGNITSDGLGGRQILIRPPEPDDAGKPWKFFPPHDQLPDDFPEPTPPTPAQDDIWLTEDTPLLLVLPQLQHFPEGASISVSHARNGTEIVVDASSVDLGYATCTIYGPHEYLYPLGSLDAGQYHLAFNCTWSSITDPLQRSFTTGYTGYVDFQVHAVPEPAALALVGPSLVVLISMIHRRTKRA